MVIPHDAVRLGQGIGAVAGRLVQHLVRRKGGEPPKGRAVIQERQGGKRQEDGRDRGPSLPHRGVLEQTFDKQPHRNHGGEKAEQDPKQGETVPKHAEVFPHVFKEIPHQVVTQPCIVILEVIQIHHVDG